MISVTTIVVTPQLKNDIYPNSEVIKSSTLKWTIYNVYVADIKWFDSNIGGGNSFERDTTTECHCQYRTVHNSM